MTQNEFATRLDNLYKRFAVMLDRNIRMTNEKLEEVLTEIDDLQHALQQGLTFNPENREN